MLFAMAEYILYEGNKSLLAPPEIQSLSLLAIAGVGPVVNLVAMRMLDSSKTKRLKGAYLEVWNDMLNSVGVIGAAAVIWLTSWVWVDAVVAISIGLWVLPRT